MAGGPGKAHRKGLSVMDMAALFPDEAAAVEWFEGLHWPDGDMTCLRCGSKDGAYRVKNGKPMPYRCRTCKRYFSLKTNTVMEDSKLPLRTWAWAIYIVMTSLKGVSSMKLHRDLGVRQQTAWFMLHRIREAFADLELAAFEGPVEVDESYFGGKKKNQPKSKQSDAKGGTADKTAVLAVKDRKTKKVAARVIKYVNAATLQGFVKEHAKRGATVYTDGASSYRGLAGYSHASVAHSKGEYVKGDAHTQGVESFWSTLKRAYMGTFHRISERHLGRYVNEFAGRQNVRELDTDAQMREVVARMVGRRLTYQALTADNGMSAKAT